MLQITNLGLQNSEKCMFFVETISHSKILANLVLKWLQRNIVKIKIKCCKTSERQDMLCLT